MRSLAAYATVRKAALKQAVGITRRDMALALDPVEIRALWLEYVRERVQTGEELSTRIQGSLTYGEMAYVYGYKAPHRHARP